MSTENNIDAFYKVYNELRNYALGNEPDKEAINDALQASKAMYSTLKLVGNCVTDIDGKTTLGAYEIETVRSFLTVK